MCSQCLGLRVVYVDAVGVSEAAKRSKGSKSYQGAVGGQRMRAEFKRWSIF